MRQSVWGTAFVLALCVAATMLVGATQAPSSLAPAPEALTLRVIVVASDDEARQVIAQVKQGADFAAVAASVSHDPTRSRGGLLGRTSLSTLRQELRDALQGLSVGQVTGPVRVPTGYAVLKVVEDAEADETSAASGGRPLGGSSRGGTLPVRRLGLQ